MGVRVCDSSPCYMDLLNLDGAKSWISALIICPPDAAVAVLPRQPDADASSQEQRGEGVGIQLRDAHFELMPP